MDSAILDDATLPGTSTKSDVSAADGLRIAALPPKGNSDDLKDVQGEPNDASDVPNNALGAPTDASGAPEEESEDGPEDTFGAPEEVGRLLGSSSSSSSSSDDSATSVRLHGLHIVAVITLVLILFFTFV